jgi:hypothetical protein
MSSWKDTGHYLVNYLGVRLGDDPSAHGGFFE